MYKNAIVGAISVAALVNVAQAAQAQPAQTGQSVHEESSPSSISYINPPVHVVTRMAVVRQKDYTVKPGDTLSGISEKLFHNSNAWPRLYGSNVKVIGNDPNLIKPGQELDPVLAKNPVYAKAAESVANARQASANYKTKSSNQTWGVTYGDPNKCGDGDSDGWDVACQAVQQAKNTTPTYQSESGDVTVYGSWPGGSFGNCVVQRESGGNSQVMNSTGHYGLYQFSASTWAAYGGNPATFGHASVAEQEAVFMNAIDSGGQSNWSLYDGC